MSALRVWVDTFRGRGQDTALDRHLMGLKVFKPLETTTEMGRMAIRVFRVMVTPPFTWVRWAYPFDAQPGKYTMRLRATDGAGAVMDQEERDPLPDGATGWPRRRFTVED